MQIRVTKNEMSTKQKEVKTSTLVDMKFTVFWWNTGVVEGVILILMIQVDQVKMLGEQW